MKFSFQRIPFLKSGEFSYQAKVCITPWEDFVTEGFGSVEEMYYSATIDADRVRICAMRRMKAAALDMQLVRLMLMYVSLVVVISPHGP
jgi:hypothetical protein